MLLVLAPIALVGQVAFDVASIQESTSLETGGSMRLMPDGGVRARNMAVRALITIAYQLQTYQLVNAPGWAREARYNIEAKPVAAVPREQTYAMLQALLVERFRLAFHRERRDVDGFALQRVRTDRLGPDLKLSALNCEKDMGTTPKCRQGGITVDTMTAFGAPLWSLLQLVTNQVGAPVSDETGLTGTYDIQLRWSNDVAPGDDRPSILTALQEQLGLKLERRRVMTEVVVVDRLERATPD
ncbi:MAG TPA: TIGR03435 family protein [Vicinamibacterales bacterium]|nr:TIGR03435 family protein [Vicinamibacterales bacterium]